MFDPNTLNKIDHGSDINILEPTKLKNLQRALSWMTYPISAVDGAIGPNTRNAFAEFKSDIGESDPTIVTATSNSFAIDNINEAKALLDVDISTTDKTKLAIGNLCGHLGIGLDTQIAYVLATAQWETNHTLRPVKEAYMKNEAWREANFRYYPYYGRGYVQLTWKRNYSSYSKIMRETLVAQPDFALEPQVALFVLVHGFKLGNFTGRKIEDYINDTKTDFVNARRCINGLDRWEEIKEIAESYLN